MTQGALRRALFRSRSLRVVLFCLCVPLFAWHPLFSSEAGLFTVNVRTTNHVEDKGDGFVIAACVIEAKSEHLSAVFALKRSVDALNVKYSEFILLHDESILYEQVTFLSSVQISCRLISPRIEIPKALYEKLAIHSRLRPLRDRAILFQKFAIFQQLQDFRRVLYLDLDVLILSDPTVYVLQTPLTSDMPLAAVPEKHGLEPELNSGLLIFDPALVSFTKLLEGLDDNEHRCGYRADDQSYLCHYFYERWHKLPHTLNVLAKASSNIEYGSSDEWVALHFNGKKPWDPNYPRTDKHFKYVELWRTNLVESGWSQLQKKQSAIVYLITDKRYLTQLGKSFNTVRKNWLDLFSHPLIFFLTDNISEEMVRAELQEDLEDLDVNFAHTEREFPAFLSLLNDKQCKCCCNNVTERKLSNGTIGGRYHLDYCLMSRFRTFSFYDHPAMSKFRYFAQLDTDIFIEKPMPYDPLVNMSTQQGVFGFAELVVLRDSTRDCNLGLYESIAGWFEKNHIVPAYVPERGTSYAGNFNLGDLDFFRSVEYKSFSNWINNDAWGVWTHRWVDQAFLPNIIGAYHEVERHLHFRDLFEEKVVVHKSASLGRVSG